MDNTLFFLKALKFAIDSLLVCFAVISGSYAIGYSVHKGWMHAELPKQEINHNNYAEHS